MAAQRILIVDDEPVLRALMAEILSRNDFQTDMAEDGVEGLNILQNDAAYALIISDVHMPRMDGINFCRTVRQDYPMLPILMTSVHWKDNRLTKLLQDESLAYLPRPFTARQLVSKVKDTIARFG